MIGIYTITHIESGKVYVGSSIDLVRREKAHLSNLRSRRHRNVHLQRAWDKYGESAFVIQVVEETTEDLLISVEQKWIDKLDAANGGKGYNACLIAASVGSLPKSAEHRRKIGDAHKGSKRSEEAKARMSAAMTGKKRSMTTPEHAAKISAAKKGKPMSEEAKRKLSITKTGVKTGPWSEARKAAFSAALVKKYAEKSRTNMPSGTGY